MGIPIRWGILGTGSMAAAFVRDLGTLADARAQAVGSRDAAAAAAFAGRLGVPHSYGAYDAVLGDPEVEVVYVATVNPTHRDLCLRCLDAGKPVLCEKPFTLNAAEARAVVERARYHRLFCMEAMWMRCVPGIARLKQLLEEGAIGTPRYLAAHIGYPFVADPAGRQFNPALGGGALLDLGVYALSLAYFLFGPPEEVSSRVTLAEGGVDESEVILLGHAGGRRSVLTVSLGAATPNEAFVMGTAGQVRVHEPFYRPQRLTVRTAEPLRAGVGGHQGRLARLKNYAWLQGLRQRLSPALAALTRRGGRALVVPCVGEGYRYEAAEVMRCLREGKRESPAMPLDETVRILETMDGLRKQWGVRYPGE